MAEPFIKPTVGSSGVFTLREPFDADISPGVSYTCQGIRRLSEYLANNEEPWDDIYLPKKIPEDVYQDHLNEDIEIVSLQGEMGQWVYVPVTYVVSYPSTNGIPYRSIALSVGLPALPANRDYGFLFTNIKNLIRDSLGVDSTVDLVETSKVTLVDSDKHAIKQASRNLIANAASTDRARYMQKVRELESAKQKIQALEAWVKANRPPP